MNREDMRTQFLEGLGMQNGDLDVGVIDRYLQKIYQRSIPNRIGEASNHDSLLFGLAIGTDVVTYVTADVSGKDLIRSVTGPVNIWTATQVTPLDLYTDPTHFYTQFPTVTSGTPLAVLCYAREFVFRPDPSAIQVIQAFCNLYRNEFTSSGVLDDAEAFAVVHGAQAQRAADTGQDDYEQKFDNLFRIDLAELASKYGSGVRKSRPPGDIW
jgi:hypothetical protein